MDLAKMPNDKKLELCRWYFRDMSRSLMNAVNKIFIEDKKRCSIRPFVGIIKPFLDLAAVGIAGFAFLPFIWTVNAIWFFSEAFRKPEYEQQKDIKKYVIFSAIGSSVWFAVIAIWVTLFQLNRDNWGPFADQISFIIPLGLP